MTDLPPEDDAPEYEEDVSFIERADTWVPSERFKLVMFTAMVLGLAVLVALNIGGFIDRSHTRALVKTERQWVIEVVEYQAASNRHHDCVNARDDEYRFAEQRYLDSGLTGPHEGEPATEVLRADWLAAYFKAAGARDQGLKSACPPLPVEPMPPRP